MSFTLNDHRHSLAFGDCWLGSAFARVEEAPVHRHLENQLLARADGSTFAALKPYLAIVRLNQGDVISETHDTVRKVYFPHVGILSCIVELVGGGAIETGMIGKDGQFGAAAALDHKVSLNVVNVQIAGDASVIDADRFRQLALEHPPLRTLVMAYEQFFLAQVQQTCACNAVHKVEARICKWLLRMQRLVGNELLLTQEFLAEMMGVRRTSVTEVAIGLQAAGMITYKRGRIRIIDAQDPYCRLRMRRCRERALRTRFRRSR